MRKHPLIWYVWVSFPEELSVKCQELCTKLMTEQARKQNNSVFSATFCTFKHI